MVSLSTRNSGGIRACRGKWANSAGALLVTEGWDRRQAHLVLAQLLIVHVTQENYSNIRKSPQL